MSFLRRTVDEDGRAIVWTMTNDEDKPVSRIFVGSGTRLDNDSPLAILTVFVARPEDRTQAIQAKYVLDSEDALAMAADLVAASQGGRAVKT